MTATLCSHNWNYGTYAIDSAIKVKRKSLLPNLIGLFLEEPSQTCSCIIEENIDMPFSESRRFSNHILYVFLIGNITHQAKHLARIFPAKSCGLTFEVLLVDV